MKASPPAVELQAGDVYRHFLGMRLIVAAVQGGQVTYCCKSDKYTGPPRKCELSFFVDDIAKGRLRKVIR